MAAAEWLLESFVETELSRIAWRGRALSLTTLALILALPASAASAAWPVAPTATAFILSLVALAAVYCRGPLCRYLGVAQACLVINL